MQAASDAFSKALSARLHDNRPARIGCVNGGVKTGHGAEQKSATAAPA